MTRSARALRETFDLAAAPPLEPRYNIAPTQESLVVRSAVAPASGGASASGPPRRRRGDLATWGFPAPAADRRPLINARAETVAEKPSFRDSFARRRCLVPADGFFEWRRAGGRARPFHFTAVDGAVLALGGLWRSPPGGADASSPLFVILTVPANELVARVHPRMPLILPPAAWDDWLDETSEPDRLGALLVTHPAAGMASREVSTAVNSVVNDSPACLAEPEPPSAVQLDLLT